MGFELLAGIVVITFHRCFFQRPVHALDLTIGPGMVDFGQAMLNAMFVTDLVKYVVAGVFVPLWIGELDTIIPSAFDFNLCVPNFSYQLK